MPLVLQSLPALRRLVPLLLLSVIAGFSVQAQTATGWRAIGAGPSGAGPLATVHVTAVGPDGTLYAGGRFKHAGGQAASHVARWDGTSWHPLGDGLGGFVESLAVRDDVLFAAGSFRYIGRWDGTSWTHLGVDAVLSVSAMIVSPSGDLIIAGSFRNASGMSDYGVRRWDGTSLVPLGGAFDRRIYALAYDASGLLHAGGEFSRAGVAQARRFARWDGSTWTALTLLPASGDGTIRALLPHPDGGLYAGGDFGVGGGVVWWTGGAPHALGDGPAGPAHALALDSDGTLYAATSFIKPPYSEQGRVEAWDGTTWHAVADTADGRIHTLTIDAEGRLFAGGAFTLLDRRAADHAAMYVGGNWLPLGASTNAHVSNLQVTPDGDVLAGGAFTTIGGTALARPAILDDTGWHQLGDRAVSLLTVAPDGTIYGYETADDSYSNRIVRFDEGAGRWMPLSPDLTFRHLTAAATDAAGALYLASLTYPGNNTLLGRVGRWNGASWTWLGEEMDHAINTLAVISDGSLLAAGGFSHVGEQPLAYVARWDGSEWQPFGDFSGPVMDFATGADGALYAAGTFHAVDGVAARRVARWDGASWHPLGDGLGYSSGPEYVRALAVDDAGTVYAGGVFFAAEGRYVNNIARWDGTRWEALGSGMSNAVYTLAVRGNDLFAGGMFITAGDSVSPYVARWQIGGAPPLAVETRSPRPFHLEAPYPNPFDTRTTIPFTLARAAHVHLALYDVLGREVAVLVDAPLPAGQQHATLEAHALPPSVYFYRLHADGHRAGGALTLMR